MTWRAAAIVLASLLAPTGAEPKEPAMADRGALMRDWVEVSEEGDGERIVLRPSGYAIPPSRGGRRQLHLSDSGNVRSLAPGPADALETRAHGGWSLSGDTLNLDLGGWQGEYRIEQLDEDILVLRRR